MNRQRRGIVGCFGVLGTAERLKSKNMYVDILRALILVIPIPHHRNYTSDLVFSGYDSTLDNTQSATLLPRYVLTAST